jgi:hypothetical protein
MIRRALIASLLVVACKNDASQSAPLPLSPAPGATPGASTGAAPAATDPAATRHGGAPVQTAPRPLEKLADGRVGLGPFSMVVPEGWAEKPSTSSMRAAQFQVPAVGGAQAELIVYYFGEGGAGSVQANVDRWLSQFKQADGRESREVAKIEQAQFAGREGSLVSVSGRYVAPAMPGGEPMDKPDQALLAAIVNSAQGPYYFRLVGDTAAVSAHSPRFRELLASLKAK